MSELGGGITNRNYKVSVDGGVFVLRMGGAKTDLLGIDRSVEHAAGMRAFEVGVGPEVVAFVPAEGWLVARFIEGRTIPIDAHHHFWLTNHSAIAHVHRTRHPANDFGNLLGQRRQNLLVIALNLHLDRAAGSATTEAAHRDRFQRHAWNVLA